MPYNEPTFGESGEVYTDNVRNSLAHVKSAAEAAQATADNAVASIVATSQTADEAKEIALAAQGYLETPTDDRVAGLVDDPASATATALSASYVRPRSGIADTAAPLYYVNVKDFGAVGDYQNTAYDDTADIQAAIDAASAAGGGIVQLPPGKYRVSQIVIKEGVCLRGTVVTLGGITTPVVGTEIIQKEASNVDVIRVAEYGTSGYVVPHGVEDVMLYGADGATGGCGYATRTAAGAALLWQHGAIMHNVITRRFAEDGVWIGGGSGVQHISTVGGYMNGGYALHIVGAAADSVQHVNLTDIWGDGNLGGAALCIENQSSGYSTIINSLKSERITNTAFDPAGVPAQANALHLKNCGSFVVVNGLQHISSQDNTYKPGDAIAISGTARPTVKWSGVKMRVLGTQTTGATPLLLNDTSLGGSGRSIPADVIEGVYGTSIETRAQTVGAARDVYGEVGDHTKPGNLTQSREIRGNTPGLVLHSTAAAANEKTWEVAAAPSGQYLVRAYDDAGSFGFTLIAGDRTGAGTPALGFYGATPVAKAANPGTATGTDAAVINNIVTALRNLGLVT